MRSVIWPGPRTARICFLAVGLFLTVAAAQMANGQTPDVLYGQIGASDAARARAILQETLETRRSQETAEWQSDAAGISGTVTPLRTYRVKGNFFCRDFRETLIVTGSPIERVGTACRRVDGVWIRMER